MNHAKIESASSRFLHLANALSEEFEGAATLVAKQYSKQAETLLVRFLLAVDKVDGHPYQSPIVRQGLRDLLAGVEELGLTFFGPQSAFAESVARVSRSMTRNGLGKLAAEFKAQRFTLKQVALDSDAIVATTQDAFELASKNLADVTPLKRILTEELMKGNGARAVAKKLVEEKHIVNGKEVPWLEDLTKGKKTWTAEQRARLMARTEPARLQMQAYDMATRQVEPDPGKRLYRWVSVLGPTSTQDSIDRHGHIMSRTEWDTHPWPNDNYVGLPPLRPNDRCSVIFYRKAWLDAEELKRLNQPPGADDRRILVGNQRQLLDELEAA